MSRVHDVLRFANRREVAREVTRRGYRVSGEALNKWVRDEKEFPAIVERIVFDLFTISGHEETAPPEWARRLLVVSEAARQQIGVSDADLAQAEADLVTLRVLGPSGGTKRGDGGGAQGGSASAR